MKTYPIVEDKNGSYTFAFEIENSYIGIGTICRVLTEIEDITDVKKRKPFIQSGDVYIKFKYKHQVYIVWEPYGDNSRYWVGPDDLEKHKGDIEEIENAFKNYSPPYYRKIVGDILTLQFLK